MNTELKVRLTSLKCNEFLNEIQEIIFVTGAKNCQSSSLINLLESYFVCIFATLKVERMPRWRNW